MKICSALHSSLIRRFVGLLQCVEYQLVIKSLALTLCVQELTFTFLTASMTPNSSYSGLTMKTIPCFSGFGLGLDEDDGLANPDLIQVCFDHHRTHL